MQEIQYRLIDNTRIRNSSTESEEAQDENRSEVRKSRDGEPRS